MTKPKPHIIDRSNSTRPEVLFQILSDRKWHETSELVSHVGHTFAQAKWRLIQLGYQIERRRATDHQFAYRLQPGTARRAVGPAELHRAAS